MKKTTIIIMALLLGFAKTVRADQAGAWVLDYNEAIKLVSVALANTNNLRINAAEKALTDAGCNSSSMSNSDGLCEDLQSQYLKAMNDTLVFIRSKLIQANKLGEKANSGYKKDSTSSTKQTYLFDQNKKWHNKIGARIRIDDAIVQYNPTHARVLSDQWLGAMAEIAKESNKDLLALKSQNLDLEAFNAVLEGLINQTEIRLELIRRQSLSGVYRTTTKILCLNSGKSLAECSDDSNDNLPEFAAKLTNLSSGILKNYRGNNIHKTKYAPEQTDRSGREYFSQNQ